MSKSILIIDDEAHIRRMMRITLEAAGYSVAEAPDGPEGLKLFGDGSSWDGVLLDQRMPGMDGLEVLKRIKQTSPSSRVIMATAYASIDLAVDAMKIGASDFVRKPMTPDILRNAVSAALMNKRGGTTPEPRKPLGPSIHIVTMNGFSVLETENLAPSANERRFIVQTPEDHEHEVLVEISEEAVAYVERMIRRKLPPENSFWSSQARRLLTDYLWKEGSVPPTRKLTLHDVSRDEIPVAENWNTK